MVGSRRIKRFLYTKNVTQKDLKYAFYYKLLKGLLLISYASAAHYLAGVFAQQSVRFSGRICGEFNPMNKIVCQAKQSNLWVLYYSVC